MNLKKSYWLGFLPLVISGTALAHPGHGGGFMDGVSHPLSGLDHLLAMFAVGIWAAQLGGRAIWAVPAGFVTVMTLAAWVGTTGIALPMVQSGIATSVLVLGLLITFSIRVTPILGGCLAGLFAIFHGYAHGAEMPGEAMWPYGLGFVLTTVLLHGIGLFFGIRLRHQARWLRGAGVVVAMCGVWMVGST